MKSESERKSMRWIEHFRIKLKISSIHFKYILTRDSNWIIIIHIYEFQFQDMQKFNIDYASCMCLTFIHPILWDLTNLYYSSYNTMWTNNTQCDQQTRAKGRRSSFFCENQICFVPSSFRSSISINLGIKSTIIYHQ